MEERGREKGEKEGGEGLRKGGKEGKREREEREGRRKRGREAWVTRNNTRCVLTVSGSLIFATAFFFAAGLVAAATFLAGEDVLVLEVGVPLLLAANFFFFGCRSNSL